MDKKGGILTYKFDLNPRIKMRSVCEPTFSRHVIGNKVAFLYLFILCFLQGLVTGKYLQILKDSMDFISKCIILIFNHAIKYNWFCKILIRLNK